MITYENHTVRLWGTAAFTLLVGFVFLTAIAGLIFGVARWRKTAGKVVAIVSVLLLLLLAAALLLVLITVASGSMG